MLVVISDLHFTDGTSGAHNLPVEAFNEVFLDHIIKLAKGKGATELKLLLLGDIPDLVRSEQWFEEDPADRPWGDNGLRDIPNPQPGSRVEQRCLKILGCFPSDGRRDSVPQDTILYKNWDTFAFFRSLEKTLQKALWRSTSIPVEIIYVVGNHDRLCNLYPSVRDELRRILGITVSPSTVAMKSEYDWWYRYDYVDEKYGVYARHGHQFDAWNFGGGNDLTRLGHLQVPIGDIISTEFAVNLPRTLALMRHNYPMVSSALIENLKEVDNVRPLTRIMEWFHYKMKQEHSEQRRQALDETFDQVLDHFLNINLVQQWRSPETRWDEIFRAASHPWLRRVIDRVTSYTNTEDLLQVLLPSVVREINPTSMVDPYCSSAYEERLWRENPAIQFVLYGHTHRPFMQPLDGARRPEVLYLNSGTWRSHIYRTVALDSSADFVKLKQMTYLCFYHAGEDKDRKEPGTVSFDVWTGHKQKYYAN
jgi:UDP-2,3-diacylglucosamine pyrophosphatase LpxH